MNNTDLNNIDTESNNTYTQQDCPHCSASSILLSSNHTNKEYLLYFQYDNIRLIQMDELGIDVLGDVRIRYCMFCGRKL